MKPFTLSFILTSILMLFSCEKNEIKQEQPTLKKAEIIFDKSYPEIKDDLFSIIRVNNTDELFLIGAESIIKLDKNGSIKWVLAGSVIDLAPTHDGGCIIILVEQPPYSSSIYYLVKIDFEGVIKWKKSGENYKLSKILIGENDEIYGIADARVSDNSFSNIKPKFFKFSQNGDYLFSKFLIDRNDKITYQTSCFSKLINDRFVIGTMNNISEERENFDYNIIEFDLNANNISERHYGGYRNEYLADISEHPDGGLILVGISESKDGDIKSWRETLSLEGENAWVVKLGQNREIEWEKIMGGSGHTYFAKALYHNNKLVVIFETSVKDVDFKSPEDVKTGYIVFDNLGNYFDIKYIEAHMVWSGTASCAFDSNGNLIVASNITNDYDITYALRLIKMRAN